MYDRARRCNYFTFLFFIRILNVRTKVMILSYFMQLFNIFNLFVHRWNGVCTSNGKYGLYAPARGGLELINLKTGSTLHVLIPRVAEGVFSVDTQFTRNDLHVIYYHSGHKSIRVFR